MNTLATLNDALFPFVLFFTYFCTACIILHNQRQKSSVQSLQKAPLPLTVKEAFSPQYDPEPIKEELTLTQAIDAQQDLEETLSTQEFNSQAIDEKIVKPVAALTSQNITLAQQNSPTQLQTAAAIIDKLNKRQVRKLCAPLGIKQKTNGVEKTTELMIASVRRKFKENPQQVIEVISDRLPELLPSQPLYQQQTLPEAC
ncbi:MAG: hypothetical protein ACRDEA_21110 [Microcystaceae cyanobacterium]